MDAAATGLVHAHDGRTGKLEKVIANAKTVAKNERLPGEKAAVEFGAGFAPVLDPPRIAFGCQHRMLTGNSAVLTIQIHADGASLLDRIRTAAADEHRPAVEREFRTRPAAAFRLRRKLVKAKHSAPYPDF